MAWHGRGMVWHGMVGDGMTWQGYGMNGIVEIWYGICMVWHGMVGVSFGMAG